MAFIVEQLAGDRSIQIGYEEVIRPFSFGTNWQKIRVGVLWAANGYALWPDNLRPYIGICTGNAGRLTTATDALWVPYGHSVASSGVYVGTPPAVGYQTSGGTSSINVAQRVGDTINNLGTAVGSTYTQISANPSNHMTACMFTVTKGTVGAAAVGLDLIYHVGGGTAGTVNVSRGTFLAQMENETAAISPMTRVEAASSALPLRFVKDWDSMLVGWLRSTPTITVSCMTVVRFQ